MISVKNVFMLNIQLFLQFNMIRSFYALLNFRFSLILIIYELIIFNMILF